MSMSFHIHKMGLKQHREVGQISEDGARASGHYTLSRPTWVHAMESLWLIAVGPVWGNFTQTIHHLWLLPIELPNQPAQLAQRTS